PEVTPRSSTWCTPGGRSAGTTKVWLTCPSAPAVVTPTSTGSLWIQTWTCSPGRKPSPVTVSGSPARTVEAPRLTLGRGSEGRSPTGAWPAKWTGTRTSAERSVDAVWSARVAMTQLVPSARQSTCSSAAATVRVTSKDPPGPNGIVRSVAYDGGFEEIHADEEPSPSMSTPPTHGDGAAPGPWSTHRPT